MSAVQSVKDMDMLGATEPIFFAVLLYFILLSVSFTEKIVGVDERQLCVC